MRILFDILILNHFEDKSFLTSSISTDFQASFLVTVQESVLANSSPSCREEIIYNTACPVNSERCLFFINTGKRFYRKLTKSPQGLQIRNALNQVLFLTLNIASKTKICSDKLSAITLD